MFAALTAVAEERDRYLYALEQARWDIRLLYASVALSPETDLGLRYLYADLDAVLSEQPNDPVLSEQPNDPVLLEMPNDPVLRMPDDRCAGDANDAVRWEKANDDAIPLPPVPAGLSKEE